MRNTLLALALCACAPPAMDTFNQLEVEVVEGEAASASFVEVVDSARDTLHVALPAGEDVALTDAIVRAWDRGVEVEVVTDIDRSADAGIANLLEVGVPTVLADDGITYFDFNLNADVGWTSEQTIMSHAYAIADEERVVTANRVGHLGTGSAVVLSLLGESLVEDLLTEHNQVFGGADATSTTAFDGLAKSVADFRWMYQTQSGVDLELWFGPQERLTKRIIDTVYGARASIYVMTNDLTNEGLAYALQAKAEWGFDVKVVVGPGFESSNTLLSRVVLDVTPDVEVRQVTDVDHVPTVVLVDYLDARDGLHHPSRAFVLTHDLYSAARLYRGSEVVNDQLIDGALWVLNDYDEVSPELLVFYDDFFAHFDRGSELWIFSLALVMACNGPPSAADLAGTRGGRVDAYFNDPGTNLGNMWESDAIDVMIDLVDSAQVSIDFAVMGFTYDPLVEAFVRAHDRGVEVRMVGDAGHLYNSGYERFYDRHIPIVTGNMAHIMHDKFMIVDGRFVFASTANWSVTDLVHNSNNFVAMDSPHVAADFQAEFDQMWDGRFGVLKVEVDNGRVYELGDTTVEVWFSPNEDAMGRILELVDAAEESIRFTIFAFTKDQVGSAFVRKQEEFTQRDLEDGVDLSVDFHERRSVAGVIDQSQLHSNQQYHEVYRLLGAEIPLRMDGIDSGRQPGDYQAGGGRLHSKTMVIDAHGANPVVISGSFNWSASATQSNDEFLLVFKGPRVAQLYDEYFEGLWGNGKRMGTDFLGETVEPGAVTIDEVMWYGVHDNDVDGFDEFIELRNHTDQDIHLDLWQIANADDVVVGLPPGSTVPAFGRFLIVDHVTEIYQDGAPQDELTAYLGGDLVVNAFNDNRQSRLYLKDEALELFLKDPAATIADVAGDGGPAFAGGPDGDLVRSMERLDGATDGTVPGSWKASAVSEGGSMVNPDYRSFILATPDEENSP